MANFSFKGRNRQGETVSGDRVADSRQALTMALRREQIFLLEAQEKNGAAMRAFEQLRAKPRALNGGMRYLDSPRHAFYVQFEEYLKELERVRKRVERAAS